MYRSQSLSLGTVLRSSVILGPNINEDNIKNVVSPTIHSKRSAYLLCSVGLVQISRIYTNFPKKQSSLYKSAELIWIILSSNHMHRVSRTRLRILGSRWKKFYMTIKRRWRTCSISVLWLPQGPVSRKFEYICLGLYIIYLKIKIRRW
jgi:hypothetical protein